MADLWLNESELLQLFNRKASRLMIDKIAAGELSDIVQTLSNCDILLVIVGAAKGNSAIRARASSVMRMMKSYRVSFKCELDEVEEALT